MEGEEELQSLDKERGVSLLLTDDAFEKENTTSSQDGQTERDHWTGRFEFLLAIVGYTVGIGSIWRFPMICAKNGGGAFLNPFAFFLIVCGGPLYYMEVCLGQFSGKSAAVAFELCPLFKGMVYPPPLSSLSLSLSLSLYCQSQTSNKQAPSVPPSLSPSLPPSIPPLPISNFQ